MALAFGQPALLAGYAGRRVGRAPLGASAPARCRRAAGSRGRAVGAGAPLSGWAALGARAFGPRGWAAMSSRGDQIRAQQRPARCLRYGPLARTSEEITTQANEEESGMTVQSSNSEI